MTITELITCLVDSKELHDISETASEVFGCEIRCFITSHLKNELVGFQHFYTDEGGACADMLKDIKADVLDDSGEWSPEALYVCEIFGVPGCCVFVWSMAQQKILLIADRETELKFLFEKLSADSVT